MTLGPASRPSMQECSPPRFTAGGRGGILHWGRKWNGSKALTYARSWIV